MKLYKIPSFTDKNKEYVVRNDGEDWYCNCPRFLFRNRGNKPCKHITTMYTIEGNEEKES